MTSSYQEYYDMTNKASSLFNEKNYKEALALFQAAEAQENPCSPYSPELAGTYQQMGLCCKALNDTENALKYFFKAFETASYSVECNTPCNIAMNALVNIADTFLAERYDDRSEKRAMHFFRMAYALHEHSDINAMPISFDEFLRKAEEHSGEFYWY